MIEFHVLGSLALVREDGREARPLLVRPKQMALLSYLVLHQPRGWTQRNSLLAMFWPESDERHARFSLRSALHGLRAELGSDAILARGDDELMVNPDLVRCDALSFEDALDERRCEDALALYRGPLLEGLVVTGIGDFQIWADERRDQLRRRAVAAAVALADDAEVNLDDDGLARWTRRALELSPYEETLIRRLVRSLDRRGERAEALNVYEQWAARLRREMESEPSPETTEAVEQLRGRATPPRSTSSASPVATGATPTTTTAPPRLSAPTPATTPRRSGIRPRHVVVGMAVGVALVALGLLGALGLRQSPPADPTATGGAAVLPFNYSGDAKYAALGDRAASIVSDGLGDAGPLRSIDTHIVGAAAAKQSTGLSQVALGDAVAKRLGATHFVVGSIAVEHDLLRMQAALYAVGHETAPIGRATASGSADSLLVIGERVAFDLFAARVGGVPVQSLGTSSPEALRAYFDGERQLFSARYAGAADAYSRAIVADSQFARAYYRLSYAGSLSGHDSLSRAAGDRAHALRARLVPNDRVLLDAWLSSLHPNIPMSIFLYEKALSQDERNLEAWLQLAEIRFHWGPLLGIAAPSAADAFQHVAAIAPSNGAALIHLARIEARNAANGGGFDTLAAAARKLNLAANEDLELRLLGAILSGKQRARDSALAEAAARGAVAERTLLMMAVQFADTTVSSALARDLTRADSRIDMRVTGYIELAQIAASHGQVRAALQAVQSLAAISPDRAAELRAWILSLPYVTSTPAELRDARAALGRTGDVTPSAGSSIGDIARPAIYPPRRRYLDAVLSLLAGDTARATAASRELLAWPTTNVHDSAFAADYGHAVAAELLLRASPAKAAAAFSPPHTQPDKTYPDLMSFFAARERFLRAEALERAGRTNEALTWYETFPDPAGYDMWFLAPSLKQRARLYAMADRTEDARLATARLTALWRGADAPLSDVIVMARP